VAVVAVDTEIMKKRTGMDEGRVIQMLTDMGMPTEKKDGHLAVEITPNRPDLFPMEGIVRALLAYAGGKACEYKVLDCGYSLKVGKGVGAIRPFVRCAAIKGVTLGDDSIKDAMQMQEKLHETVGRKRKKVAVGLHNLDAVKFPLEYVVGTEERFVPLDCGEEMGLDEVLEKHQKGAAYAHLARGAKVLIKDSEGVISFPPIINSERTRVDENTSNLLVDVTGTSKEAVEGVLNIITTAFADAGAKVYSVETGGVRYPDLSYSKMAYKHKETEKVLGNAVSKKNAKAALERMGYRMKDDEVRVPPYRIDIISQIDVIEDIAIGHGYGNFAPELPHLNTIGGRAAGGRNLHAIMCGMGFLEVKNYVLTNEKSIEGTPDSGRALIANSTSEEFTLVRTSLLPGLLSTCRLNKTRGLPQKFYELGEVWDGGEEARLGIIMTGQKAGFSGMQSVLQALVKETGAGLELRIAEDPRFIPGRCCDVIVNGKRVGVAGEVSPHILERFGLEYPASACEIRV